MAEFTANDYFQEGYSLYINSEYKDAAAYLSHAAHLNHAHAQELYADICYRQLDDEPHSYSEAAMWYLLASFGDTDAASYLESILPGILKENNEQEQIKKIMRYWCLEDTLTSSFVLGNNYEFNLFTPPYTKNVLNEWLGLLDKIENHSIDTHIKKGFEFRVSKYNQVYNLLVHLFEQEYKLIIDCSKNTDTYLLEIPIIVYYCKNIVLYNFQANNICYNMLYEFQKYMVQPHIVIKKYKWDKNSEYISSLTYLFESIQKHGITITFE